MAFIALRAIPAGANDSQGTFLYRDTRGFFLTLPEGLKPVRATDYGDMRVIWSNFPVPPGTNLVSKTLTIVPGAYTEKMEAAAHFPATIFKVNGTSFQRVVVEDQAMGTMITDIIYTWKRGRKQVHFDFELRATVIANMEPPLPREYDRAGQLKESEQVMETFRPF